MIGTTLRPAETRLAQRALELLAGGPQSSVTLIEHVCQMSGAPPVVAEHMAAALFAERTEFVREADGRWRLAGAGADRPAASPPDDCAPRAVREPSPVTPGAVPSAGARALRAIDYVVVDVETTGTSAAYGHRITEIAAVLVSDGQVVGRFESLVNPERSIPPMITALTNISWEMVKDAPRFADLCDDLLPLLQHRVFVAHNAEFDWRFVSAEVARATGRRLDGDRVCTVRLARRLLPHLRSRRLDALAHFYGIAIEGRHRAGGDAVATAHVLLRLLAAAADRDCHTWDGLCALLGRGTGRARKGRRPSAMPTGIRRDTSA